MDSRLWLPGRRCASAVGRPRICSVGTAGQVPGGREPEARRVPATTQWGDSWTRGAAPCNESSSLIWLAAKVPVD